MLIGLICALIAVSGLSALIGIGNFVVLRRLSKTIESNQLPDFDDMGVSDLESSEDVSYDEMDELEIRSQEPETSQFTSSIKECAQQEIQKIRRQPWAQQLGDAQFCELIDEVIFDVKLS